MQQFTLIYFRCHPTHNYCIYFCRHWLFGDKVPKPLTNVGSGSKNKTATTNNDSGKIKRCRGWFPRKCAVELVESDSVEHQKHFYSKKKNN